MEERIQKILSARGVASRRKAEEMIQQGRVCCNGTPCALGDKADPDVDHITVDGVPLPVQQDLVYLMLNKPRGFVTTLSDEKGRKNVSMLVADCGIRVYPIGRLDMDSEGMLLFTNDGAFADKLMHPRHEVNKTYCVSVDGFTPGAMERLQEPMVLDGYQIRTPEVKLISSDANGRAQLQLTIHEGRNRQVRRMCAIAGMRVVRLIRIREGAVELGNLKPGKWRYLTLAEKAALDK